MNTCNTSSANAANVQSARFNYPRWIVLSICVLAGLVALVVAPCGYATGGIRFFFQRAGSPGVLTFRVRDNHGQPVPGITVMSESFSGTTEPTATDASGAATISPGEQEVLAVYIDGHEFRFRPHGILEHFSPDCAGGLTFDVYVRRSTSNPPSIVMNE